MSRTVQCRRLPKALLAVLAVTLVSAQAATAAPARQTVKKAMWGPIEINGVPQFPVYKNLGVGIYQYPVVWAQYAPRRPEHPTDPDDPAYVWTAELDSAVSEAAKNGIAVALRVSRAPRWSNGGRSFPYLPKRKRDYADFLEALSKRYPSVRLWEIWEEPNRASQLYVDTSEKVADGREIPTDRPLTRHQKLQIRAYAELIDTAYGRLKRLDRRNRVVAGNVTSCGSVGPRRFIGGLRLPDGRPPRMDEFGINPYSYRRPDLALGPFHEACADFGNLDTVMTWVDRALDRAGRNGKLPIFISEYTQPTEVSSYMFNWHLTLDAQARFVTQALKAARAVPRIRTFGWYAFQDLPPLPDGRESRVGLVDKTGRPKPAFYAFKRG